jgi:hypothetical protein
MKVLEKNRIKEYDDKGNLISDREATLEDLLNVLVENYELDISIDLKSGTGKITIKRKQ